MPLLSCLQSRMAILPPQPPGIRLHFIVKRFFVARSARRFSCTDMRAEAATTHSNTLKTRMALLRAGCTNAASWRSLCCGPCLVPLNSGDGQPRTDLTPPISPDATLIKKTCDNNTSYLACSSCKCQRIAQKMGYRREGVSKRSRRSRVAVHWLVEAAELVGASRQDAHDVFLGADVLIGHFRQ